MQLRFWAATDTGRVRDHNEDNFLVDENLQLFVVCDGMGGHAAGEVASAVCVRTVRDVIAAEEELLTRLEDNPSDEVAVQKLKQLLRHSVKAACRRIWEMAQQDPNRRGMGTTCVALVLVGKRGFVGHVGDSRMYRIRRAEIEQITDDHSLLNEMIRQGKVPPETSEAEFPHKNAVTRAVGVRETVEVDAFSFDIEARDRLLMCSDGLSEYFDDSVDLLELMDSTEPEETTTRCIDFANESGGKDNITVVVIDCERPGEEKKSGPERAEVIEILRTTPYFHYLAPPELEQIRQMATRVEHDADEDVVADDEDNDRLYLILKGSVSLQLDGEQVSVLTTGEHFGEMALIDAQDEKDTNLVARTVEPSIFLTVERDQFVSLLRTEPGLAIKLLWNFVQVFADRLQSVPPEYRYTPDEWRSDPDAIADVTPPSGTLVFEDDLERTNRAKAASGASEDGGVTVKGPPELPPGMSGGGAAPAKEEVADTSPGVVVSAAGQVDDEFRETMEFATTNRDGMDTLPPDAGSVEEDEAAPKGGPGESPSVEFNPSTARRKPQEPSEEAGLTSGTYDQSLLEAGASDEATGADVSADAAVDSPDEEPTVTINRPEAMLSGKGQRGTLSASETTDRHDTAPSTGADKTAELKKTMKIDWSDEDGNVPPELDGGASGQGSANVARSEQPRPVPSSHVREKTSRNSDEFDSGDEARVPPVPGADGGDEVDGTVPAAEAEGDDGKKTRRPAISGRSEVTTDDEDVAAPEEPKVMISSELVADLEEDT